MASLGLVQSRSLIALQNLITVLPEERWGGASGWNTIWTSLFSHCTANCSDLSALVGAVQALAEKLQDTEVSKTKSKVFLAIVN